MTSIEQRPRSPRSPVLGEPLEHLPSAAPPVGTPVRTGLHRSRTGWVVGLCAMLPIGALTAGIAIKLDQDAREQAAHDRVVSLAADSRADQEFYDQRRLAASAATGTELRARTLAEAQAAAQQARAVAEQAEHAGAQNLATLQAAAQSLEDAVARLGDGASPAQVRAAQITATTAEQTAQAAETAWQQQEQARLAAEQAAQQAARQAAAAAAAARHSARTGSSATATTATTAGGSTGSGWAAGVQAYGVSGLGAALNQQRADAGLNELTVVGSSSLADHAAEMAAAGSIWHSGHDNIVGWVEPVSDAYMIQAYMDSPPHRAWILKEGVTQVAIGAVTINGVLYTAMLFS